MRKDEDSLVMHDTMINPGTGFERQLDRKTELIETYLKIKFYSSIEK